MCTPYVRREANRFNWMIKGKLIDTSWSDEDIEKTYNSYFNRLWNNNENYVHEDGFDKAWRDREEDILSKELESVCVLGYN